MSLDIAHCGDNQSGVRGDADCTQQISVPRVIQSYNAAFAPGERPDGNVASKGERDNDHVTDAATMSARPTQIPNLWLQLATHLTAHILQYVTTKDLLRCRSVCRDWKKVSDLRVCWSEREYSPTAHFAHESADTFQADKWLPKVVNALHYVESVNLSETRLTDAGIQHLTRLPFIHSINLAGTRLTDAGLDLICNTYPDIQALNLCETRVTDQGLRRIATSARKLRSVAISCNNYITRYGWTQLAHLMGLAQLDITAVDNDQATIAILTAILNHDPPCSSLTRVSIHAQSNKALYLVSQFPSLKELQIEVYSEWHDYPHDTPLLNAASPNNINTNVKPRWELLERADQVSCLSIPNNRLDDTDLQTISKLKLKSLRSFHVDLNAPRYTDVGVRHLAGMTQLHELSLAAIRITDDAIHSISRMPDLQSVSISRGDFDECRLTDQSLEYIGKHLRSLQQLRIGGIQSFTDQGLKQLANCPNLWKLVIERCDNISEEAVRSLQKTGRKQLQAVKFNQPSLDISSQTRPGTDTATQEGRMDES